MYTIIIDIVIYMLPMRFGERSGSG